MTKIKTGIIPSGQEVKSMPCSKPRVQKWISVPAAWVIAVILILSSSPAGRTENQDPPRTPDPETIEIMRMKLHELQRQREARSRADKLVEAKRLTRHPHPIRKNTAYLLITSEMDSLRLIGHFRRIDEPPSGQDGGKGPARISFPILHRGEFWLTLPSGQWSWHISTGRPHQGKLLHLQEDTLEINEGTAREIRFDERVENSLKKILADQ
jgi:hypothetical protein